MVINKIHFLSNKANTCTEWYAGPLKVNHSIISSACLISVSKRVPHSPTLSHWENSLYQCTVLEGGNVEGQACRQ